MVTGVWCFGIDGGLLMEKREKKRVQQSSVLQDVLNQPPSKMDPLGSWTGRPMDRDEIPVQDADDL